MKKKILTLILSLSMTTVLLAGCGGSGDDTVQDQAVGDTSGSSADNSSGAPAKASSDGDQITLRFAWWGGDERAEATLAVIDQFEKLPRISYRWIRKSFLRMWHPGIISLIMRSLE